LTGALLKARPKLPALPSPVLITLAGKGINRKCTVAAFLPRRQTKMSAATAFIDDRQTLLTESAAIAAHYSNALKSTLALFVFGILTDDHDPPFSFDDLALFADRFY